MSGKGGLAMKGYEIYYPSQVAAIESFEKYVKESVGKYKRTIFNRKTLTVKNNKMKITFKYLDLSSFYSSMSTELISDKYKNMKPVINELRSIIKRLQEEQKKYKYSPEMDVGEYWRVKLMVENGKSLADISRELECSASRVHQMWQRIQRIERRGYVLRKDGIYEK